MAGLIKFTLQVLNVWSDLQYMQIKAPGSSMHAMKRKYSLLSVEKQAY